MKTSILALLAFGISCNSKVDSNKNAAESVQRTTTIISSLNREMDIKIDSLIKLGKEEEALQIGKEYKSKRDSVMAAEE